VIETQELVDIRRRDFARCDRTNDGRWACHALATRENFAVVEYLPVFHGFKPPMVYRDVSFSKQSRFHPLTDRYHDDVGFYAFLRQICAHRARPTTRVQFAWQLRLP
jgi:hypothetical protein